MIDAYLEKSPAAMKVPIFLEEAALDYRVVHVAVALGEQLAPQFRAIAPNNKVPVIVDHAPADGGAPQVVFESAAILFYLAEKQGRYLPSDSRGRTEVMQWLSWQAAGLSPMSGQAVHFSRFAPPGTDAYARERYVREVNRLYGVLNRRLAGREFICDDYGIADMASYPWTLMSEAVGQEIAEFPHLNRWRQAVGERPGVVRAYERISRELRPVTVTPEEFRRNMFGHTARSLGLTG
jgi:GST-like protein